MSPNNGYLAYELRDGLLQDLVAVGLLIEAARRGVRTAATGDADAPDDGASADAAEVLAALAGVESVLARAAETVEADLALLRSVIDRLRPAA